MHRDEEKRGEEENSSKLSAQNHLNNGEEHNKRGRWEKAKNDFLLAYKDSLKIQDRNYTELAVRGYARAFGEGRTSENYIHSSRGILRRLAGVTLFFSIVFSTITINGAVSGVNVDSSFSIFGMLFFFWALVLVFISYRVK
jgi:hypothetical protein